MNIKHRNALPTLLPENAIGVELGVAKGAFSKRMLESERFSSFISIDRWDGDRGHGLEELQSMLEIAKVFPKSIVQKASFDVAVRDYADGYFDFIYVDGYAHTGQEHGNTLYQWWPKLKQGGIFAGHDYCSCWLPTLHMVNEFCATNNLELHVTEESCEAGSLTHPSWWVQKGEV